MLKRNTLSKVARSNLNRLASSLETSTHPWDMSAHDTCALGQAMREFGLETSGSVFVAEALALPLEKVQDLFIGAKDDYGVEIGDYKAVTKQMMVDTLRHWARTGKVRWVFE